MKYHWIVDITEFNIHELGSVMTSTLYMPQILFSCNVHFIMFQICTGWQSKRTVFGFTEESQNDPFDFGCTNNILLAPMFRYVWNIVSSHSHCTGGVAIWANDLVSWIHHNIFHWFLSQRHKSSFEGVQHEQLLQNLAWQNNKELLTESALFHTFVWLVSLSSPARNISSTMLYTCTHNSWQVNINWQYNKQVFGTSREGTL